MNFNVGQKYLDRIGRVYTFARKGTGSVIVFEDADGKATCRHESGNLRWDEQRTDEDIVEVVK
jgi:hypothetical protein